MEKHKKNYIIYLILGIFVLFFVSIGFVLLLKNFFYGKVNEDDVYINSSSYEITIEDKLSVTNDFGKMITDDNNHTFGYVEFEIINDTDKDRDYQIFITEKNVEEELNPNYIKFYLTDFDENPFELYSQTKLPSYVDLNYIDDKPSSKLLLSDSVKGNDTKKYKLRVWLTDTYIVNNSNKIFSFEIGVRAV